MSDKIIEYNIESSEKLGWTPSWFGQDAFDDSLTESIKGWQRSHGLSADGLVGPMSFRRIFTEREAEIHEHTPKGPTCSSDNYIIYNSKPIPINWDKVVLWSEPNGLVCPPENYRAHTKGPRDITMFVNHWDVCLSAESCAKVIDKRGISIHWCIDNDGTIYQLMDANHVAYQAGSRSINKISLGVEISNAYYTKYQSWYKKNGYGSRDVVEDAYVHGTKLEPHLDFYPVQIEALTALWEAVHNGIGVPLEVPVDEDGSLIEKVDEACADGDFKGFVNHYNLTRRKIDCAGLDMLSILEDIKSRK